MAEQTITIKTNDGPMNAYVALPQGQGPFPGILVYQEAFGVNDHMKRVCQRFAQEGYIAFSPELFHRSGPGTTFAYADYAKVRPVLGALNNEMLLADVEQTYSRMLEWPGLKKDSVYCVGYCMGGFVSMLGACHLPFKKAVSYYGGGMVSKREGIGFSPLLDEFSNLKCPALLFYGGDDQSIPPKDIDAVRIQLESSGKNFEIVVYPGVGHAFACDDRPNFSAEASEKSWEKTLQWLKD